ncbi:SoxR reducing system RseC family protein [Streptomyces lincolnensis]|uniref:SoxR reducing system RseC family protein n=1 Tax=Streptomyces lincolnensis TaxID=1915 RepID=UPI001E4A2F17|nr:SoxR reducing system RseC family protein [Streptomyces lincolnensis]MCD7440782.1 SoxR reducing system RseC family protein [Streptomyces lincolnensis]
MSTPLVGMIAGMALAFAGWFGGFGASLLVAALGGLGWAVGRWIEGGGRAQDVRDMFERSRR